MKAVKKKKEKKGTLYRKRIRVRKKFLQICVKGCVELETSNELSNLSRKFSNISTNILYTLNYFGGKFLSLGYVENLGKLNFFLLLLPPPPPPFFFLNMRADIKSKIGSSLTVMKNVAGENLVKSRPDRRGALKMLKR